MVGKASPRGTAAKGSGSGGAVGTPSASASEDTSGVASMHARRVKAEHGTPASGAAAFTGLAGLAALAGAVSEPQQPAPPPPTAAALAAAAQTPPNAFCMQIASFYALQTELLLFKVRPLVLTEGLFCNNCKPRVAHTTHRAQTRAAQLEAENATLRRLLHGQASTQPQQQQAPAATPQQQQGAQPAALQLVAPPPPPSSAAAAWAAQPQLQNAANITSAISAALAAHSGGGEMMTVRTALLRCALRWRADMQTRNRAVCAELAVAHRARAAAARRCRRGRARLVKRDMQPL